MLAPSDPEVPDVVRTVNVTSESITVVWIVPNLAYTPEEYTVVYGTNEDVLDQMSDTISSTTDLSAVDQQYALVITDLEANTQYYFQIVSENTQGSVRSDVISATTLEAGLLLCLI